MAGRSPRILFAPAAEPQIGGGHVMRDLALFQALRARGAEGVFAVPPWGARLISRFADPAPDVLPLARSSVPELIAAAALKTDADVLVVDDFSLSASEVEPIRDAGRRVVVIDDLADRTYAADLLVDPSFGRTRDGYAGRVPETCEVLCGPAYALLRPAFRQGAGQAAPLSPSIGRVFVSFGLSDVDAIAARAVGLIRRSLPEVEVDVALGADAASLPGLAALSDPRLHLHPDARDVAGLIAAADLAVGAGGSSTWERFALGAPTLAVVVAENQRGLMRRLHDAGILIACDASAPGFETDFGRALEALGMPERREAFRRAGLALCDGRGAERVAEAVLSLAA